MVIKLVQKFFAIWKKQSLEMRYNHSLQKSLACIKGLIIIFIQETNITRSVFQMVPAKH